MFFQCHECKKILMVEYSDCGDWVRCGSCGEPTKVPKDQFSPRSLIDEFVIERLLGHGGMGTVYLAHQLSLDRPVALKILMEDFTKSTEFISDFVRESRAAARLVHPNIVQSYKVGESRGIYFFAMEYVSGRSLKQIVEQDGRIPWDQSLKIIRQSASALDAAWRELQLVHRDIKPDNIMLDQRGVAKLADLGLAMAAHDTVSDDDEVMGTPQFISPEQILGNAMDVRSDVYSLGATLFYILTAHFPYTGASAREIVENHIRAPIPNASEYVSDVPQQVSAIVTKMLAKRLEDRYMEPAELIVDIDAVFNAPVQETKTKTGSVPRKKILTKKLKTRSKAYLRRRTDQL